ncbi:MAG TPA: type II toxin-antitoxin system VapC family toxin [Stellaceae bacterium]
MLDTNICIYVMKNYPARLQERFNRFAEQLCVSSITLGELYFGAEHSARPADHFRAVEEFAARLAVLDFSAKAAAHYGRMRADLARRGTPIGALDLLIGAHARAEGLTLVTNNVREFERLAGLDIENWA